MSIITQLPVQRRFFAGYDNPSLPIGTWRGLQTVTGDGSGGFAEVDLILNLAAAPRDANFYSLEHFFWTTNDIAGNRGILLSLLNLETALANRRFSLFATIVVDTTIQALDPRSYGILPIFMGSQVSSGVTVAVAAAVDNINSAVTFFGAEGYIWGPRSINAPGGPSRPLQGLYRS